MFGVKLRSLDDYIKDVAFRYRSVYSLRWVYSSQTTESLWEINICRLRTFPKYDSSCVAANHLLFFSEQSTSHIAGVKQRPLADPLIINLYLEVSY